MSAAMARCEVIRASAGTGKTHQLAVRFLRLMRQGEPLDETLATTFTRKAAGEILDRVLGRLAEAATSDGELEKLRRDLGDSRLARDECLSMLVRATQQLHRLRIGTLDSFFGQLAGSFSLELDLPPGWTIIDEHVDQALRAQAIGAMLEGDSTANLMTLLHALTKGETNRSLASIVHQKVRLLYTTYLESDPEAWKKIPRLKRLSDADIEAALENVRSVDLPNHKSWATDRATDVERAETGQWVKFLEAGISGAIACGKTSHRSKEIEPHHLAAYGPLVEHAKATELHKLAEQTEATWRLLDRFHAEYIQRKQESGGLRFDDITRRLAVAATADAADANRVTSSAMSPTGAVTAPQSAAFRLDGRLRHLLLDEFQDTSLDQWSVLRPFARQVNRAASSGTFFCVGDMKQAIYGWRGGVAEVFDAATAELSDVTDTPLDTSYRSSPTVIDVVNQIFTGLDKHPNLDKYAEPVAAWQSRFTQHTTARTTYNGYACMIVAPKGDAAEFGGRTDDDDDSETDGEAPSATSQTSVTLRRAARQAADLHRQAPGMSIGVLVRRNESVREVIGHLRDMEIEASEEAGSSLDDSAAVRLILSLIRLADHPSDRIARFHLATSPLGSLLGLSTALASPHESPCDVPLGASCGDEGSATGEFDPQAAEDSDSHFIDEAAGDRADETSARRRGAASLARAIRRRLMEDGYGATVYGWVRQLAPVCNARELRRAEKLIGLAYAYDEAATTRPGDFRTFVEMQRVSDPTAANVRVMNIHQSKGLQFDAVVLAELESNLVGQTPDLVVGRSDPTGPIDRVSRYCNEKLRQLLPESWQQVFHESSARRVNESLCLLYVAVTRAIHGLYLVVSPSTDNEKSLRKNYAGLLRAALVGTERIEPDTTPFEIGDPRWWDRPKKGETAHAKSAVKEARTDELEPLAVRLASSAARRSRNLERVSPSGLEGGSRVRLNDAWTDGDSDRTAALTRGTLMHAWFEQIAWLEDGTPDDATLRQAAVDAVDVPLPDDELHRLLDEFRELLADRRVAECLSRSAFDKFRGATLVVENERPIAVRQGDRLLVGAIDRLVIVYDKVKPIAAEIVDFKTDSIPPGDNKRLRERTEHYRPQIAAYRSAVERITGLSGERVAAKLLFTVPRRTVPIAST